MIYGHSDNYHRNQGENIQTEDEELLNKSKIFKSHLLDLD